MSYHQTNEVLERITEKLIKKHADRIPPWKPVLNTHFGRMMEVRQRQLQDALMLAPEKERDQIAKALNELHGFIATLRADTGHGWYCFYCGHLNAEEVTKDETCSKCGAVLSKASEE